MQMRLCGKEQEYAMRILPPYQPTLLPGIVPMLLSFGNSEEHYTVWRARFIHAILQKLADGGIPNIHKTTTAPGGGIWTYRLWLANGSLAYVDCGPNLEWATAEYRACSREGILQEKASERILQNALSELIAEHRLDDFSLYKNNVGPDELSQGVVKEVTYASHHNYSYLTARRAEVFSLMTDFIPVSLILTGNGHVCQYRGTVYYTLSQRAPHIERVSGEVTTRERSIVNTRDEPLMDRISGLSRFHLISCDATRCEYQTWLKDAITHLVLRIAEEVDDPSALPPKLNNPLEDLRAINLSFHADLDYKVKLNWMFGEKENFVDYNYRFLNLAKQLRPLSEDEQKALEAWEDVLDLLRARAFKKLVGKLDWVTKWYLLKNQMARGGYGIDDPRAYVVDMEYHNISTSPDKSWFARLDERGFIHHLVSEEEIRQAMTSAPQTRAQSRSDFIKFCYKDPGLRGAVRDVNWDSASVEGYPLQVCFGERHNPFLTESSTLQKFVEHFSGKSKEK
jgi:proteasome accessory factor A